MFRERTYRFSWPVLAAFMMVAILLIVRVANGVLSREVPGTFHLRLDVALIAGLVLACIALRYLFVVHVGPEGLRTTDGVGRYHEVRWNEMRSARNLAGFLYVPHGRLGAALCFPTFLDDAGGFRDYVLAYAPEGNPLRAYFAAR